MTSRKHLLDMVATDASEANMSERSFRNLCEDSEAFLEPGYQQMRSAIPPHIYKALVDYALNRQEAGGFVMAVLRNDLVEAAGRGDGEAMVNLRSIMQFITGYLPSNSWGSPDKVQAWLDKPKLDQVVRRLKGE